MLLVQDADEVRRLDLPADAKVGLSDADDP